MMNVQELAKRAGVPAHVVRFYSERGLLRPERNPRNRYRQFKESELYRLKFICRAKRIGFTLNDIELILNDADNGAVPCPQVRTLVKRRAIENEQRLADEQRLLDRIREAVKAWETMPDRPPDAQSLCRLIDAIALDGDDRGPTFTSEATIDDDR